MGKKWQDNLTNAQRRHLKESNMNTRRQMKQTFEHQKETRERRKEGHEPCFDCKAIAVQLGYPV